MVIWNDSKTMHTLCLIKDIECLCVEYVSCFGELMFYCHDLQSRGLRNLDRHLPYGHQHKMCSII